jgi:hypothetical protein
MGQVHNTSYQLSIQIRINLRSLNLGRKFDPGLKWSRDKLAVFHVKPVKNVKRILKLGNKGLFFWINGFED